MEMKYNAELNDIWAREQCGSRKFKTAIECALNERLNLIFLDRLSGQHGYTPVI